ncbi:alpha-tocopherol transfer protein-like [Venturia canescens]|uniref:alpha-tocopherol transfer protein-like n=1 Tax=Venturia canescens TaxID=32260 RepID=UPI001C9D5BA5|nr:alpha-tocopherol transfer protein-like [Venturia canescens]XP_043289601.1 alpha-tocopherol transfer protein-like [Venturia canescens]XP_043289609.1 alpha-tocopherol transfer protein-like [Venturia canescens]XP_043289618.1 alpha-tocopherol transfer protein-like [Venturia canescens]XP_043289627.1 alpha-tocopherol transfer protein-like [Venturia canescens]
MGSVGTEGGGKMITMQLGHTLEQSKLKYPELNDDIIKGLRLWAEAHNTSNVPDEQLALFAHSCYYDLETTKRCVASYYKLRAIVPEFFHNRDPRSDSIQRAFKTLHFLALPVPDDKGNRIIFHRLADTRPSSYMLDDGIKVLMMTLDASLYDEGCAPGYIFLFDMAGVRLTHLTRLSITSIRRFFEYLQEGLPVRLKAIHVLNVVWFMDKVLSLVRPFMKRELFEMLHLHTGDPSEVYELIPQKCLPKDYGGELGSVASLHEAHCTRLDQLRDYFLEEERLFRSWSEKSDSRRSSKSSKEETPVHGVKKDKFKKKSIDVSTWEECNE